MDGDTLLAEEFYRRLAAVTELPSTAQINPERFASHFQRHIDAGDEIVVMPISRDLSGTYQSALLARDMVCPEKIFVVDTLNTTFGLGLLVEEALRMREKGLSAAQIADALAALKSRVRLLAMVDTLKYLKMGGRISAATAFVGGVLGINPIISVVDGRVEAIGKARGRKAAFDWIADRVRQDPPDLAYPVFFGHSAAPQSLEAAIDYFSQLLGCEDILSAEISATVGTHVGPGATGLAYIAKEDTAR